MEHVESRGDYDTLCCLLDLEAALNVLMPYEYMLLQNVFVDNVPIDLIVEEDETPAELIYSHIQYACYKVYCVMNGYRSPYWNGAIQ